MQTESTLHLNVLCHRAIVNALKRDIKAYRTVVRRQCLSRDIYSVLRGLCAMSHTPRMPNKEPDYD
jgi:hypothetical protein